MDKRKDLALALVIAAVGAAIIILSFDVSVGQVRDPIGSRAMPLIVGGLVFTGGTAMAVRRLVRWHRDPVLLPAEGKSDEQPAFPAATWRALLMWALCFGYVLLLPIGGFLIVTPLLIAGGLLVLHVRRPVKLAVVSVVPVALLYWVLGVILNVRLPLGPLSQLLT